MHVTLPQPRRGIRGCESHMLRRLALTLLAASAAFCVFAPGASADRTEGSLFEAPRELLSGDAALRARTLDEIQGFGVSWMRVVLYWRNVAPNPTDWRIPSADLANPASYDWSRYDRAIDEIRARHIRVLLDVSGPVPNWATRSRHSATMHPSSGQFERFMTAVGTHFGALIDHWSIWN